MAKAWELFGQVSKILSRSQDVTTRFMLGYDAMHNTQDHQIRPCILCTHDEAHVVNTIAKFLFACQLKTGGKYKINFIGVEKDARKASLLSRTESFIISDLMSK